MLSSGITESHGGTCASLFGDDLVFLDCDVLANSSVGSWSVVELKCSVDAFSERKRVRVIVELNLFNSGLAFVDSTNTWVLLVEPSSLHISLLLWIVILGVDFANKI